MYCLICELAAYKANSNYFLLKNCRKIFSVKPEFVHKNRECVEKVVTNTKRRKHKIYEAHFLLFILGNSTRKPKLILAQFYNRAKRFSLNNTIFFRKEGKTERWRERERRRSLKHKLSLVYLLLTNETFKLWY